MSEAELLLRDLTRAWRHWKLVEARVDKDYSDAAEREREMILAAYGDLQVALDAALDAVERGQG